MYYFAFAHELNRQHMKQLCPDSKPGATVRLPNYKLVFTGWSRQWRGGVATIKPFRGEAVTGALYEISEQGLQRLDRHFGYPAQHNRLNVNVFDEHGQAIPAVTYIKSGQQEETKPSPEYLAAIQQNYRDWGLI